MNESSVQITHMAHNAPHERAQAETLVNILLDRGYGVSVFDGEEWVLARGIKRDKILAVMGSTDSDVLLAHDENGDKIAHFRVVYGNNPGELIADHSDNHYAHSIWNAWSAVHPS